VKTGVHRFGSRRQWQQTKEDARAWTPGMRVSYDLFRGFCQQTVQLKKVATLRNSSLTPGKVMRVHVAPLSIDR
jgi:hypothetical protein